MAFATVQHVMVGSAAVAVVARQPIVAAEAEQQVAADPTVNPVPAVRSDQRVPARSAVNHRHELVRPSRQRREVRCQIAGRELDAIVAAQSRDAELLNQNAVAVSPFCRQDTRRGVLRCLIVNEQSVGVRLIPSQEDRVVPLGAGDDQDIDRVVVLNDLRIQRVVVAVAVERVVERRVISEHVEIHDVDAATAVQRIVAVLAFQFVGVTTTPQSVVSATAAKRVLPGPADEQVRPAVNVGQTVAPSIERNPRHDIAGQIITAEEILAAVTDQRVLA